MTSAFEDSETIDYERAVKLPYLVCYSCYRPIRQPWATAENSIQHAVFSETLRVSWRRDVYWKEMHQVRFAIYSASSFFSIEMAVDNFLITMTQYCAITNSTIYLPDLNWIILVTVSTNHYCSERRWSPAKSACRSVWASLPPYTRWCGTRRTTIGRPSSCPNGIHL